VAEMRVLTVRQPWAWAIIYAGKDIENRTRNVAGDYRGPLAIHVATKYATEGLDLRALDDACDRWHDALDADCNHHPWQADVGAIIGVVDLVGVHESGAGFDHKTRKVQACSPWADWEGWHLELANARQLAQPIPYRGGLGLRRLPADITEQIEGPS